MTFGQATLLSGIVIVAYLFGEWMGYRLRYRAIFKTLNTKFERHWNDRAALAEQKIDMVVKAALELVPSRDMMQFMGRVKKIRECKLIENRHET